MEVKHNFDEPARVIKRTDVPEERVYSLTFAEGLTRYREEHFSKKAFLRFIDENIPGKKDEVSEIVRKVVKCVSFAVLVFGFCYFVSYYNAYREKIDELKTWEIAIENIDEEDLAGYDAEHLWDSIKTQYPDVDFPDGMALKFASLYAVNQDLVGALSIPELEFWTPIVQNKTTSEYYDRRDLYGNYSRYGTPFVDMDCTVGKDTLSKNTIIYGHNTRDRLGFNIITKYMSLAEYKKAPVVTFDTLYGKTQWKIFAVILTNASSASDNGNLFTYLYSDFASEQDFMNVISGINERSMINTGIDVLPSDKIITIYTCYAGIFADGRLVVFGRLLRDGESADVDVSKASFNSNARYPQAYYDSMSQINPYAETTAEESTAVNEETTAAVQEGVIPDAETTLPAVSETLAPEETTASVQEPSGETDTTVAVEEPATDVAATEAPSETQAASVEGADVPQDIEQTVQASPEAVG